MCPHVHYCRPSHIYRYIVASPVTNEGTNTIALQAGEICHKTFQYKPSINSFNIEKNKKKLGIYSCFTASDFLLTRVTVAQVLINVHRI